MTVSASALAAASRLPCPHCRAELAWQGDDLRCEAGHVLRLMRSAARPASGILWLEDVARGEPLVLKLPRREVPRLPEEYVPLGERLVLRRLQPAFRDGPYRVPRLLAEGPGGEMLMTFARGENLHVALDARLAGVSQRTDTRRRRPRGSPLPSGAPRGRRRERRSRGASFTAT